MEPDTDFTFDSKKAWNALLQMLLGPLKNIFNFGGITETASNFGVNVGDMLNPLTEGWDEALRGITRTIDPVLAATEDAATAMFNNSTVFTQIGNCFGGACIVGTPGDLDKVLRAMFTSMPTDNSPASQQQVIKAALEAQTQLANYFGDKLSKLPQYANATEEQITTAAQKIAEKIIGLPATDTSNVVAMNRLPAPTPGSFAAFMLAGLARARSDNPDSIAIPAFSIDDAALTAIKNEMSTPADPFMAKIHEYLAQCATPDAQGKVVGLGREFDTDGKPGVSPEEAAAALRGMQITDVAGIPDLATFSTKLKGVKIAAPTATV